MYSDVAYTGKTLEGGSTMRCSSDVEARDHIGRQTANSEVPAVSRQCDMLKRKCGNMRPFGSESSSDEPVPWYPMASWSSTDSRATKKRGAAAYHEVEMSPGVSRPVKVLKEKGATRASALASRLTNPGMVQIGHVVHRDIAIRFHGGR